jgi:CheY-like chemotaxis protein
MSNAIKFTESGTITLHAHVEDHQVHIAVSDTGIGIPESALSVIFDRFRQADQGIGVRYGGTGLGLDISKQLCQMIGGDLTVRSIVGQGSTFEFFLPLPTDREIEMNRTPNELPTTSQVFEVNHALTITQTVMIASDDAAFLDTVRRSIESSNSLVVATGHAADVMEMAQATLPDIIFLDGELSNGEGWQTLASLKADPDTGEIPIVFSINEQQQTQADTLSVAALLIKPTTSAEVLAAVNLIQVNVSADKQLPPSDGSHSAKNS